MLVDLTPCPFAVTIISPSDVTADSIIEARNCKSSVLLESWE